MSELIDNRAHRIRTLKGIIHELHRGGDSEAAKDTLRSMVRETSSTEIAEMEQQLMAEGMAVEEVQSMCDVHSQVLREILVEPKTQPAQPGHPLDTFARENEALKQVIKDMQQLVATLESEPFKPMGWRGVMAQLMDVEKHYQRKESLLFSCLERHGVTGPSQVMWGKDDEVRELLKALDEALSVEGISADEVDAVILTLVEPTLAAVEEMITKEERILFPMSKERLTDDEWGEIWKESPRYGYCLVEPLDGYQPPVSKDPEKLARLAQDESVVLPTGALSLEQLKGLFAALPVDLTFVDADDRVRYFSEGGSRVFDRSRAILGRKVQHCHPPKSVHMVEEIVACFRNGSRDVAEFWIQMGGKFVHIRYFAVRDAEGTYLGTLEVTQDATHLRGLEGERRLLEWEGASA